MTTSSETFTVRFDAAEDAYPWEVVGADGEVLDCFATKKEALKDARDRTREAAEEARGAAEEAEAEAVKEAIDARLDAIRDRLDDMSLEALRATLARLESSI
jgi:hypothetical protein